MRNKSALAAVFIRDCEKYASKPVASSVTAHSINGHVRHASRLRCHTCPVDSGCVALQPRPNHRRVQYAYHLVEPGIVTSHTVAGRNPSLFKPYGVMTIYRTAGNEGGRGWNILACSCFYKRHYAASTTCKTNRPRPCEASKSQRTRKLVVLYDARCLLGEVRGGFMQQANTCDYLRVNN